MAPSRSLVHREISPLRGRSHRLGLTSGWRGISIGGFWKRLPGTTACRGTVMTLGDLNLSLDPSELRAATLPATMPSSIKGNLQSKTKHLIPLGAAGGFLFFLGRFANRSRASGDSDEATSFMRAARDGSIESGRESNYFDSLQPSRCRGQFGRSGFRRARLADRRH